MNQTDISMVDCPISVFVFDNNFDNYAVISVERQIGSLWSDKIIIACSSPQQLCGDQFCCSLPFFHSSKVSAQDANIFKALNPESCAFSEIFDSIVPTKGHWRRVIDEPWGHAWGDVSQCQDRALINSKIGFLFSQLSLHRSQLSPEYTSSDKGENGGANSPRASNHGPERYAACNFILLFLFSIALLCGVSAYYLDEQWPGTGWVPLVVFALIAAACLLQLFILSRGNL